MKKILFFLLMSSLISIGCKGKGRVKVEDGKGGDLTAEVDISEEGAEVTIRDNTTSEGAGEEGSQEEMAAEGTAASETATEEGAEGATADADDTTSEAATGETVADDTTSEAATGETVADDTTSATEPVAEESTTQQFPVVVKKTTSPDDDITVEGVLEVAATEEGGVTVEGSVEVGVPEGKTVEVETTLEVDGETVEEEEGILVEVGEGLEEDTEDTEETMADEDISIPNETHTCVKDEVVYSYLLYEYLPTEDNSLLCELLHSHSDKHWIAEHEPNFCKEMLTVSVKNRIDQGFICTCSTLEVLSGITQITEEGHGCVEVEEENETPGGEIEAEGDSS